MKKKKKKADINILPFSIDMTNKELRQAADAGDAKAQFQLAILYLGGQRGFPKNIAKGCQLLEQSAEQGYAEAQSSLGALYSDGLGVIPKDEVKACELFRRAAEQGLAEAQSSLGSMYYQGKGVKQDYEQAYQWSLLALA